MMKYNREDRVKVLEYKFIYEEDLQVKKEYSEGSADLNYRLSFFRSKLDQSTDSNQKNLYNKIFMPQIVNDVSSLKSNLNESELTQSAIKKSDHIKPWAKKIYRQIVMATHPDKTDQIQFMVLRHSNILRMPSSRLKNNIK